MFRYRIQRLGNLQRFDSLPDVSDVPNGCERAVGWMDNGELTFTGWMKTSVPSTVHHTINDWLTEEPISMVWATQDLQQNGDLSDIAIAIERGSAIAVADGSFKACKGTSAFMIGTGTAETQLRGTNQVPGSPAAQCSYRSELAGILGIVLCLKAICAEYNIQSGRATIACDNLEAGLQSLEYDWEVQPTADHFDILRCIRDLRAALPITLKYRHVEAHQREKYGRSDMDIWAKLNDEMDAAAKVKWAHIEDAPYLDESVGKNEWAVYYDEHKIVKDFKTALRRGIQSTALEAYWIKKNKFTRAQIDTMDFPAMHRASLRTQHHFRQWLCKFTSGQGPVGRNMKRYKFWDHSRCPRCVRHNETAYHVLICPDERAQELRLTLLDKFRLQVEHMSTPQPLADIIVLAVQWVYSPEQPIDVTQWPRDICQAFTSQLQLGAAQLLFGRVVTDWRQCYDRRKRNGRCIPSADKWTSDLVEALWTMAYELWKQRNEILHESETKFLEKIVDEDKLDWEVLEEHGMGEENLPQADLHLVRGWEAEELMEKSIEYKMRWLRMVRLAREAMHQQDEDNEGEEETNEEEE